MVTNFEEAYNKMFSVKNEVVCFISWWVNEHYGDEPYIYDGKTIKIPIYNDIISEVDYYKFYGLKAIEGTLYVGVFNLYENNIHWFEIEDDSKVLTMQSLWNIVEILYLFEK